MSRRNRYARALVAVFAALAFAPAAHAEFWIGTGTTANWTTTSNWSATNGGPTNNTLPPANDFVNFFLADSISRTITYDQAGTPTYGAITLNQTGAGTLTLSLGTNFSTAQLGIGSSGHASFSMTAGAVTVTSFLTLGDQATAAGTFTMGGGSLIASNANVTVGNLGSGTFAQNAGGVSVNNLIVGNFQSGSGLYTLGNQFAFLNATAETIGGGATGNLGTGTFNQVNATNSVGTLLLENNGTYNLSGGTLNSGYNTPSDNTVIGALGTSLFNQTGGTHTIGTFNGGHTLELGVGGGKGTYLLKTGLLSVNGDIQVGREAPQVVSQGVFSITGGTATVSGTTYVASTGTVTLSTGSLISASIVNSGTFTYSGGTLGNSASVFTNRGSFLAAGSTGTFGGQFVNYGTYTADDSFDWGHGFVNFTSLFIGSTHSITVDGNTLDNEQQLTLGGGTLYLSVGLLNNGTAFLYGTVNGGTLTNNGQVTLGGVLALNNTGPSVNNGNFTVGAGNTLRLNSSAFGNNASFNLGGGIISGAKTFTNNAGGTLSGTGLVTAAFQNDGTLFLGPGALNVSTPFNNTGLIQFSDPTANLTGGAINNTGTIQGVGTVGSDITNSGEIASLGGTLSLSGNLTNSHLFTIAASSKLLVRNFPANGGIINLTGGVFDTNNHTLLNNNQISGYGTINTGGLTNNGSISITGSTSTVNGDVTNNLGHKIEILYNPAIFTGNINNSGTFKTTQTTVTFTGTYTENGQFHSDPATQHFNHVSIGAGGSWTGSTGDVFVISGDFISHSTAAAAWDTDAAELDFTGGVSHIVGLNARDLGRSYAGYASNFSWGRLSLAASDSLAFQNETANASSALYIHQLDLAGGLSALSSLSGPTGLTLYYDPTVTANAYLNDASYALIGGAALAPVPEPASLALLSLAAVPLLTRRRK